jgi:hypothetical protein
MLITFVDLSSRNNHCSIENEEVESAITEYMEKHKEKGG